jgi:hypothetical protein
MTVTLERGALSLADLAYLETRGSTADRVEAAIWAYLWATGSVRAQFGVSVYPSLFELREALATRREGGDR